MKIEEIHIGDVLLNPTNAEKVWVINIWKNNGKPISVHVLFYNSSILGYDVRTMLRDDLSDYIRMHNVHYPCEITESDWKDSALRNAKGLLKWKSLYENEIQRISDLEKSNAKLRAELGAAQNAINILRYGGHVDDTVRIAGKTE